MYGISPDLTSVQSPYIQTGTDPETRGVDSINPEENPELYLFIPGD